MSRSAMEVILDADCTGYEKLVLMVIARHGRGTNGSGSFPSVRRIARMAGISTFTVNFTLKSLKEKPWFKLRSGVGRGVNKYDLDLGAIPMLPDLWAHRSVSAVDTQEDRNVLTVDTQESQPESRSVLTVSTQEPQQELASVLTVDTQESVVCCGGDRSVLTVSTEASTKANTKANTKAKTNTPVNGRDEKEINGKEASLFPDDEPVAANRSALHKSHGRKAALSAKGKPSPGEPDQPSKPRDPRHAPCCQAIAEYWQTQNPNLDMAWGATVKNLQRWLSDSPQATVEQFRQFLRNRADSESVNHGEQPPGWIRKLTNYAHGPLDRFGKPMTGASSQKISDLDHAASFGLAPGENVGPIR